MSDDLEAMMFEDVERQEPDVEGMKKLSSLVTELESLRQQKTSMEECLEEIGKSIRRLEEEDIPNKMAEMHVAGFTMENGDKVEVKDLVRASIPEKYREQAFEWLETHGHGDLIKTEIKCALDRGDLEKAQMIMELLKNQGVFDAELKKAVHWGTLTAFVKEQLEQGAAIPFEPLGVHIGKKVVVNKKK